METPITFGARAAALRAATAPPDAPDGAVSCSEIDRITGLHRGHVWQIEQGNAENPKAETVRALARTYGCTVGWLLAGEGAPPPAEDVIAAVGRARLRAAQVPDALTGTDG